MLVCSAVLVCLGECVLGQKERRWPLTKGYSKQYDVCSVIKPKRKEEEERAFIFMFAFWSYRYMY